MKILPLILLACVTLGCKKVTPGNYTQEVPVVDTLPQVVYEDGGVLPTGSATKNDINGTTWILTKTINGNNTTNRTDTVRFISNNKYMLNGSIRNYTLTSGAGTPNYTLTLEFFQPFGGSTYSGQIGLLFVSDAKMENIEFHNNYNSTNKIRATFVKI